MALKAPEKMSRDYQAMLGPAANGARIKLADAAMGFGRLSRNNHAVNRNPRKLLCKRDVISVGQGEHVDSPACCDVCALDVVNILGLSSFTSRCESVENKIFGQLGCPGM
jgi:hypothetical protein